MSQVSTAKGSHKHSDEADLPRYTVRTVAERLGVPTATLRSWNLRYGIGPSQHSPGRHRLYSSADIAVVKRMHRLIGTGVKPGSAARTALDSMVPKRADAASLVSAAFNLDIAAASRLVDGHLRHFGVLDTWEDLIRPAFAAIGARQDDGERCIDVEHALSWTVSRSLQRLSNTPSDGSASVILACTAGEAHTLALEALRAALDEHGYGAVMLGADVPGAAVIDAIERRPQRRVKVVLWSQHKSTADIATALAVIGADAQPLLAGPGWASVTAPRKAKRVDHLRAALGHFEA